MIHDSALPVTILNVDDNESTLYLRTHILRGAGFNVIEARSGREALGMVATENPEVALFDVGLPDISGIEVCRAIKGDSATTSTLVIQISARKVASSDRRQGLESGADTCLTHPVDPEVLIATVEALLRLRRTLERTRRALEFSHDFLAAANRHTCIEDLLAGSIKEIKRVVACASAGIWIKDTTDGFRLQGVCQDLGGVAESEETIRTACHDLGYQSAKFVPMEMGSCEIGFIHIADVSNGFSPENIDLVETAASHLGPAIQRLRAEAEFHRSHGELEERVRERTAELAGANRDLNVERQRLPIFPCRLSRSPDAMRFPRRTAALTGSTQAAERVHSTRVQMPWGRR